MKLHFSSILAVLIAAPAANSQSTLSKRNGEPPAPGQHLACYTNEDSASVANIMGGAETMRWWTTDRCAPNDDGSSARMAAGDGYSFYIASAGSGDVTPWSCTRDIPPAIIAIADNCFQDINGQQRAEGSAWLREGQEYVYVTGESK